MQKKIVVASGNSAKLKEIQSIFSEYQISGYKQEGLDFEIEENGTTFYENALIKAKAVSEALGVPALADDSGLVVEALGGAPGVYSARYAGPNYEKGLPDNKKISQQEQNEFLIQQLNAVEKSNNYPNAPYKNGNRSAHYTCAMVLYLGNDRIYIAQETMEGCLINKIEEARGTGGFGYDPIFFLPEYNMTAAELTSEEKNRISHRGKATRALVNIINNLEKK
jgi:XTP/dITP diphosphohydrolase